MTRPIDAEARPSRPAIVIPAAAIALTAIALLIGSRADNPARSTIRTERVDLNHADEDRLRLLPGIGPAIAARIIADRAANGPFESVEALDRVRGIGPRTIADLAPFATVTPPPDD